jgi:exonuclease VII small subunit
LYAQIDGKLELLQQRYYEDQMSNQIRLKQFEQMFDQLETKINRFDRLENKLDRLLKWFERDEALGK